MKKYDYFIARTLRAGILPSLFGNSLHLFLNLQGKILELSDQWTTHYHTILLDLKKAGHVRDYFDLPAPPPLPGRTAMVRNKKPFALPESPEAFYTAFPTVVLYLHRMEKNLYYGALRVIGDLPNISLQRPNGVIYLDGKERLVGFNEAFFRFFAGLYRSPEELLHRPVSLFMEPTPESVQEARLAEVLVPDPAFMKVLYRWDPASTPVAAGLKASEHAGFSEAGDYLDYSNPTGDHAAATLPAPVPPRRDFSFEIDLTRFSGWHPLLTISQKKADGTLDQAREYTVGPDTAGEHSLLKKSGVAQRAGPLFARQGPLRWRFHRVGRSLLFFENGRRLLAWHDPNYLHTGETFLSVELRGRSACRISRMALLCSEKADAQTAGLPVTRLKSSTRNAFVINPMDNLALAISHPDIRGYVLENATEMQRQIEGLHLERNQLLAGGEEFLGESRSIVSVRESAVQAARSDATILIQGETGTGKEVLARFIHGRSPRQGGPFVKVDCSVIPRDLMESELFGHEKGAFTGAVDRKAGLLEQAEGGTLFLDEVGGVSRETQTKLLHFLQDHTVTRVGGREPFALDLRVVAASNVPLSDLVAREDFRADLYYRMAVVTITLPPLRDRREDIPGLCGHFIALFNRAHGREVRGLTGAAAEKLRVHAWPGNVRELKNTLERAVIFHKKGDLTPEDLSMGADLRRPGRRGKRPLKDMDAETLRRHFQEQGGVLRRVARALGVTPRAVYDKVKKCGLKLEEVRREAS